MFRLVLPALLLLTAAAPVAFDAPAAGPAQSCLAQRQIDTVKPVNDRTVLFVMRGGRTFRNELPVSCPAWARGDTGYTHISSQDQLCRGEVVQLFERGGGFQYGGCILGKFTPIATAAK